MILEEIRLKDFRCFYGRALIRFSMDPIKNVTVIYAENGVGKTTLLNALLWCFYGETTPRFEKQEDILNHDARLSGRSVASVEVLFKHNMNSYIATRLSTVDIGSEPEFSVARIETGGQVPLHSPSTFINTVIPREMASHFLFDGEHAEFFLAEKSNGSIRDAVRDILGCSLIETAIEDLRTASVYFLRQIPSAKVTKQSEELKRDIESLTDQIKEQELEITNARKQRNATNQQIEDIDKKLLNTELAKQLQERRSLLSDGLDRAKKRQQDQENEVFRWVGEESRFIVSKRITEETLSLLNEKENRGQIPSPYNEEFVKDILDAEECICGAVLKPGSPEHMKVAELFGKAANPVLRDRITRVRARLSNLKSQRLRAPGILNKTTRSLTESREEIGRIESELADISRQLKGIDTDEIAEREHRRSGLYKNLESINLNIGRVEAETKSAEKLKNNKEQELLAFGKQDERTELFTLRHDLCKSIMNHLEQQLESEESQAREFLRRSIHRILESTSRKILRLKMTDDYSISLVNTDDIALPKSSGENQLLGLAFTAALVEFAKERENSKNNQLLPGTIAPLVLDSPFGQLDPSYRRTTAEFIPNMARQVVLLVSKSQGSQIELNALENHLGAEYILLRHNKEAAGNRKVDTQVFGDRELDIVVFDDEFDGTSVEEVKRP